MGANRFVSIPVSLLEPSNITKKFDPTNINRTKKNTVCKYFWAHNKCSDWEECKFVHIPKSVYDEYFDQDIVRSIRWTDTACRQIAVRKMRQSSVWRLSDRIQTDGGNEEENVQFGLDFAAAMKNFFMNKIPHDETNEIHEIRKKVAPKVDQLLSNVIDSSLSYNPLSEYALVESLTNTITEEGLLDPSWKQVSGRLDAVGWNSNDSCLSIVEFKIIRARLDDTSTCVHVNDVIQVVAYYMLMMRHLDEIEEKVKALDEDPSERNRKLRAISNMRSCQLYLVAMRIEGAEYQLHLYKVTMDDELQRSLRGGDLSPLYSALALSPMEVLDRPEQMSLSQTLDQCRLLNAQELNKRIMSKVSDVLPLQQDELERKKPREVSAQAESSARYQAEEDGHCLETDLLLQYAVVRHYKEAIVLEKRLPGESRSVEIKSYKNFSFVQLNEQPGNPLGDGLYDLYDRSPNKWCFNIYLARGVNRSSERKPCKEVPSSQLDYLPEVPMPHNHRSSEALLVTRALQHAAAKPALAMLTSLIQRQDDPARSRAQLEEEESDEEGPLVHEHLLKQNPFNPLAELSETLSSTESEASDESEIRFADRPLLETAFFGSWAFCDEMENTTNPARDGTPFREGLRKMQCRLDTLAIRDSTLYVIKFISAHSQMNIPFANVFELLLQRSILKKQLNKTRGGSDDIRIRLLLCVCQLQPSTDGFAPTFDFYINEVVPHRLLTSVMDQFDIRALSEAFADDLPPDAP